MVWYGILSMPYGEISMAQVFSRLKAHLHLFRIFGYLLRTHCSRPISERLEICERSNVENKGTIGSHPKAKIGA